MAAVGLATVIQDIAHLLVCCRDDIEHEGEKVDWGKWAITCDDPDFGGEGQHDTGDDYGPAPGTIPT